MKIRVRAFASYRELLGSGEVLLEVPENATPESIFMQLFGEREDASQLFASTLFAINRDYVKAGVPLAEGDELSLLPPVAGG